MEKCALCFGNCETKKYKFVNGTIFSKKNKSHWVITNTNSSGIVCAKCYNKKYDEKVRKNKNKRIQEVLKKEESTCSSSNIGDPKRTRSQRKRKPPKIFEIEPPQKKKIKKVTIKKNIFQDVLKTDQIDPETNVTIFPSSVLQEEKKEKSLEDEILRLKNIIKEKDEELILLKNNNKQINQDIKNSDSVLMETLRENKRIVKHYEDLAKFNLQLEREKYLLKNQLKEKESKTVDLLCIINSNRNTSSSDPSSKEEISRLKTLLNMYDMNHELQIKKIKNQNKDLKELKTKLKEVEENLTLAKEAKEFAYLVNLPPSSCKEVLTKEDHYKKVIDAYHRKLYDANEYYKEDLKKIERNLKEEFDKNVKETASKKVDQLLLEKIEKIEEDFASKLLDEDAKYERKLKEKIENLESKFTKFGTTKSFDELYPDASKFNFKPKCCITMDTNIWLQSNDLTSLLNKVFDNRIILLLPSTLSFELEHIKVNKKKYSDIRNRADFCLKQIMKFEKSGLLRRQLSDEFVYNYSVNLMIKVDKYIPSTHPDREIFECYLYFLYICPTLPTYFVTNDVSFNNWAKHFKDTKVKNLSEFNSVMSKL